MDIKTFFELSNITDEKDKKVFTAHLKRISSKEYSNLYELFGDGISRTQFYKLKRLLTAWYERCGNHERQNEIASYGYNDYVADDPAPIFRDVQDMDDKILCEYEKVSHTRDGLYRLRTECILSWYGLSVEEIVNLKKSDLNLETDRICVNRRGVMCHFPIDEYSKNIILKYSSLVLSVNYDTYNDYYVRDSEYLIRGSTGRFNVKSIPADFTKYIEKTNGRLCINRKIIAINGVVVASYQFELEGLDEISAIKKELRNRMIHEASYQAYLPYYQKWKKLYAL